MWEWRFCVGYINSVDPVKMTAWEIMTYLQVMGGRGLSFFLFTQKINDVSHGLNWLTSSLWGKKRTPVVLKGWSPGQRDYVNCEMLEMQIGGSQPRSTEAEILALDPSHLCLTSPRVTVMYAQVREPRASATSGWLLRSLDLSVAVKGPMRGIKETAAVGSRSGDSSGFPYDLEAGSIKIHHEGPSMVKSLLTSTIFFSHVSTHSSS